MLKTMLRERLPSAAFAFIMVVSIAFIYLYTSSAEAFKWNVYEQKYVSKMTADEFLTQYPADYESARNKFFSIDNLEGIDTDDLSEDKLMALLAGDYSFSDAENIWRNRQYSMPGRFADTVINDYEMMSDMYDYYAPMLRYEERLSEKRTINERMLARTGTSNADKIKSEKILSYISEIPEKPDSIAPLVSADIFSESFAKDVLFIFFVAVLCCRMYSGYRQSGYLDFIKTTKCGAGKFFAVQYLSHLVIMTAAYILYCVLYLLFILSGAGPADVLLAVGLGREAGMDLADLALGQIGVDDVGQKVFICHEFSPCQGHSVPIYSIIVYNTLIFVLLQDERFKLWGKCAFLRGILLRIAQFLQLLPYPLTQG